MGILQTSLTPTYSAGFVSSYIYSRGDLRVAVMGALSAGAFYGVGTLTSAWSSGVAKVAAHGEELNQLNQKAKETGLNKEERARLEFLMQEQKQYMEKKLQEKLNERR